LGFIDPPYGGFFAIKIRVKKVAGYLLGAALLGAWIYLAIQALQR
jgi:hypothetical protein